MQALKRFPEETHDPRAIAISTLLARSHRRQHGSSRHQSDRSLTERSMPKLGWIQQLNMACVNESTA